MNVGAAMTDAVCQNLADDLWALTIEVMRREKGLVGTRRTVYVDLRPGRSYG